MQGLSLFCFAHMLIIRCKTITFAIMRTPDAVKEAAKDRASCYSRVGYAHLGPYQGYEVYTLRVFDELPLPIGLPEVYLFKEGLDVITVCGHDVFEIMRIAAKNTRDRRKATRMANKD